MLLHDWTNERGWDSVQPLWLVCLLEWSVSCGSNLRQ
jgi:hypothetical protein